MKWTLITVAALALTACGQQETTIVEYDVPYTGGKLGEEPPAPRPDGKDRTITCDEVRATTPLANWPVYCLDDDNPDRELPEVEPERPVEPEPPVDPPHPPQPPMPPMCTAMCGPGAD